MDRFSADFGWIVLIDQEELDDEPVSIKLSISSARSLHSFFV